MNLLEAIRNKTARVGVIGLGYVGLPLVQAFTRAGFSVSGFDIDAEKIRRLEAGESYIGHIPAQAIQEMLGRNRFTPTGDFDRLGEVDAIVICVPTPLTENREPDLSAVTGTGHSIRSRLRAGQLVVLESTTFPGTTDDVLRPILEQSGLRAGSDFWLAFSPEREDPGNPKYSAVNIPKVVGGFDSHSLELAATLYGQVVVSVVRVSSTRIAEACKILENTYRAVNIALVNELKMLFDRMGIDIWEVIRAASTKPFGFQPFYPGPGLGGHCIPIDPFYLTWVARRYEFVTRFIELAGEINTGMPKYVVGKVAEYLNDESKPLRGSKILVLGVAYKRDIDDVRESPALDIIELLRHRGAKVDYHDDLVPSIEMGHDETLRTTTVDNYGAYDAVLIVTDHTHVDYARVVKEGRLVFDTRNATKKVRGASAPNVVTL
jgi:UDP-N-acetyl-D-glucosamine dehydrogenase